MSFYGWLPGGQWGAWRWRSLYRPWRTWRTWRKRRAQRLDYRKEVIELRGYLRAYALRSAALAELVRCKQEKVTRLQERLVAGRELRIGDLRPEILVLSEDDYLDKFERDFERRQRQYEETGAYDRHERVTTRPNSEDAGADPD